MTMTDRQCCRLARARSLWAAHLVRPDRTGSGLVIPV